MKEQGMLAVVAHEAAAIPWDRRVILRPDGVHAWARGLAEMERGGDVVESLPLWTGASYDPHVRHAGEVGDASPRHLSNSETCDVI